MALLVTAYIVMAYIVIAHRYDFPPLYPIEDVNPTARCLARRSSFVATAAEADAFERTRLDEAWGPSTAPIFFFFSEYAERRTAERRIREGGVGKVSTGGATFWGRHLLGAPPSRSAARAPRAFAVGALRVIKKKRRARSVFVRHGKAEPCAAAAKTLETRG